MKTLVVYDSVFGNTEQVARAMADACQPAEAVQVAAVQAQQLQGVTVLLAGSPTRAFRPTPAMSAWLKKLPANSLRGKRVAAFDTRLPAEEAPSAILRVMVKAFGWAAKPIADRLVKAGGELAATPEGFYVTDSKGPLKQGELERAAEWAKRIVGAA